MYVLVSPLVLLAMLSSFSIAVAQNSSPVEAVSAVQNDVSQPIRNITAQPDVVLQTRLAGPATTMQSFDGLGNGFVGPQGPFVINSSAPDPNDGVGATQYVQWVNSSCQRHIGQRKRAVTHVHSGRARLIERSAVTPSGSGALLAV